MIDAVYCPFCSSPRRLEVEDELLAGDLGPREIAVKYKTSLRAVQRHRDHISEWPQPQPTNERTP